MAVTDALDILSDQQELKGTALSDYLLDVGAPNDWGNSGLQRYVQISALGPMTVGTDIQFQLLGTNNESNPVDKAVLINQSAVFKKDAISRGFTIYLPIQITGSKYSYIFLKYLVTGGTEESKKEDVQLCPPTPMLQEPEDKPNTFSSIIVLTAPTGLVYETVNKDKFTS